MIEPGAREQPGQLVILESTTYPGTTDELVRPILERGGLRCGEDFYLAFSPEREDPGKSAMMDEVFAAALDMAGDAAADIWLTDIYSCFPCAVHAACDVLSLPTDGSRPLTMAMFTQPKVET